MLTTRHTVTTPTGKEFFEYYVVFQTSDALPWYWKMFCRKGFEHCSVLMANGKDQTLNINQSMENAKVYVYDYNVHAVAGSLLENEDYTIVYIPSVHTENWSMKLGALIPTCVSLCMRITGLTFHAITPYYYYKSLIKSGKAHLMGGKPKVDTSALEAQKKATAEAEKRTADEKAKQEDLLRRQRLGRKSLLGTEGGEQGLGTT